MFWPFARPSSYGHPSTTKFWQPVGATLWRKYTRTSWACWTITSCLREETCSLAQPLWINLLVMLRLRARYNKFVPLQTTLELYFELMTIASKIVMLFPEAATETISESRRRLESGDIHICNALSCARWVAHALTDCPDVLSLFSPPAV